MHALVFALGALVCAAVNDLVFKTFADGRRPVGLYMVVIGVVWSSVFFGIAALREGFAGGLPARFWWCAGGAGAFSAVANWLLIEGMARNEVGVCSALYRLNLVPASLLAFALLGEAMTAAKLAGVALAAGAVLCFWKVPSASRPDVREQGSPRRRARARHQALLGLGMVSLAALLRAGMGIVTKLGMDYSERKNLFLAVNGILWIITGLLVQVFRWSGRRTVESAVLAPTLGYGLVSGVLVCGIVLCMALALSAGDASVVLPVMQLSFVATAAGGILFLGETLTPRKALGFALAAFCIGVMGFAAA